MKKLLICALIGVSVYACQSKKPEKSTDLDSATITPDTSERGFRMVNISVDTAVKMVASNYKSKMVLGRDGKMKEDARTVYFDLPSLKKLINNIEAEKGQGIRIYLAAYDNGHIIANAGKELDYSNSTTVVLVSTKDTLIVDPDNATSKITIHKDYYSTNKSIKTFGYFTGRTDPQNKGELCPPPSPCCKIGATLLCTPPPTSN